MDHEASVTGGSSLDESSPDLAQRMRSPQVHDGGSGDQRSAHLSMETCYPDNPGRSST